MAGTLFGVGMGPGNPDYLTVRAVEVIRSADLHVHFARKGVRGNARTIADAIVTDRARELALVYPYTTELAPDHPDYAAAMHDFYEASAERLAAELSAGRKVAVLAEGDPFFYGSFMHLWRRLKDRFSTEVIPGVTGMSGCWTRAGAPITWGDDVLTVLPGTLAEDELARRLSLADAAVVMKLGRNLPKVRRALAATGLLDRAIYVERGTMQDERVCPLSELSERESPYFSMVLVPGRGRRL